MINILFIALMAIGVLIIYPVTPRFFAQTKKFWITFGVVLVHIGAYGLLWLHLSPVLFISLLLFEGGLFGWWDPFSLIPPAHQKLAFITSLTLMSIGVVVSLSFFTDFPLWLWAIPGIMALLPFMLPPLTKYTKPMLALSITLALVYLGIIGLRTYHRFYPQETNIEEAREETVPSFPVVTPPTEDKAPAPEAIPVPTGPGSQPVGFKKVPPLKEEMVEAPGPVTEAIQNVDKQMKSLEAENARLKTEIEALKNANEDLKKSVTQKNNELEDLKRQIQGVKGAVEKL